MPKNTNIFDWINTWINNVEYSFVNLVTTLVPWIAPALPAYLTWYHLSNLTTIVIPDWVALLMAITVEFLGLAAMSAIFEADRHNKENRAKSKKVPRWLALSSYAFYLTIVVVVNIILELPLRSDILKYAEILAIALLTFISIPAFVILISRQTQTKISKSKPRPKSQTTTKPVQKRDVRQSETNGRYRDMTIDEIMEQFEVSRATAYRWKKK